MMDRRAMLMALQGDRARARTGMMPAPAAPGIEAKLMPVNIPPKPAPAAMGVVDREFANPVMRRGMVQRRMASGF